LDCNRKTLNISFLCLISETHWPGIPLGIKGTEHFITHIQEKQDINKTLSKWFATLLPVAT